LSEGEIHKKTFENEKQFGAFKEADIKELTEMGFTKDQVLEALTVCQGDKDNAANYLMN